MSDYIGIAVVTLIFAMPLIITVFMMRARQKSFDEFMRRKHGIDMNKFKRGNK